MDPSDEDVQTLLAMGFPSESEVRRALKMAKNDLSDAVDILTNGQVMSTYDDLQGPISGNQDAAAVSIFLSFCFIVLCCCSKFEWDECLIDCQVILSGIRRKCKQST